jgi:glycine cleavage system H protein
MFCVYRRASFRHVTTLRLGDDLMPFSVNGEILWVSSMQMRYTQDHQYIVVEDDVGTVGITNHAQEKLSDVTTVELPRVGAQVQKGGAVGVVESVKAASDLYSPVSGEILGVNEALTGKPELINEDAEGAGWIYKIKLAEPSELNTLLDREAYLAYAREQG